MREIALDTETTGFSTKHDRIVEIACIELVDRAPTGRRLHKYINPQKPVSEGAFRAHGLTNEHLSTKPVFAELARDIAAFIGQSPVVAHNASYDFDILNNEFERAGLASLATDAICTLALARGRWPERSGKGAHTLDAVCSLLRVDTSHRVKHGAMLDAELVALIYPLLVVSPKPFTAAHKQEVSSLPHGRVVADEPLRNRVVVACPHCSGRSRLPNGRSGAVSCQHCGGRYWANTT